MDQKKCKFEEPVYHQKNFIEQLMLEMGQPPLDENEYAEKCPKVFEIFCEVCCCLVYKFEGIDTIRLYLHFEPTGMRIDINEMYEFIEYDEKEIYDKSETIKQTIKELLTSRIRITSCCGNKKIMLYDAQGNLVKRYKAGYYSLTLKFNPEFFKRKVEEYEPIFPMPSQPFPSL